MIKNKEIYDVCIIGGGISGLSAAHELSKHLKVCVIERENVIGGVARSWKNKDNVFIEHSWRGFPIVYKNVFQILKEIPYENTTVATNVSYNYIHSIKKNIISDDEIYVKPTYIDSIIIIIFSILHIFLRGNYNSNLSINSCLSKQTANVIAYIGFGLDPAISSISDLIKCLFLLQINRFAVQQKIFVGSNGYVKSLYNCPYEYNVHWNNLPKSGEYVIIKKRNDRYYISETIFFELIDHPFGAQAITKSMKDGWFNPWKTHLENNNVSFFINSIITNVNKIDNLYELVYIDPVTNNNFIYCKNIIVACGFQNISKLFTNIVPKKLYDRLNITVSISIIATTNSIINHAYSILVDSPIILSYQIINKVFNNSTDIPYDKNKVFFNLHCIINDSKSFVFHNKTINRLTSEEFKKEILYQFHILCKKNSINITNIDYIDVSDEVIFDGLNAHLKFDTGYYITKGPNIIEPYYENLPNIYFAGHDIKNSIDIRCMESACESGKNAAKLCLDYLNIKNDILLYQMEKVENIYYSIIQSYFLKFIFLLFICLTFYYTILYKKNIDKLIVVIIFFIISYVFVCIYQLCIFGISIYQDRYRPKI